MTRRRMRALIAIFVLGLCALTWVGCARERERPVRQRIAVTQSDAGDVAAENMERLLQAEVGGYRKVHVFVALCDNRYQGIVPVPAAIGNGQDPQSNLYWGARYGLKRYFSTSREWKLVDDRRDPAAHVLERLVYRHATQQVYLVADAYDGAYIKEAITAAMLAVSGRRSEPITIAGQTYVFGGGAQLIAYIGHNGLMDFPLDADVRRNDARMREAIILSCKSHDYFAPLLKEAGAYPLLTTNDFMCPEAYTLEAALTGWVRKESATRIHQRAAQAYSRYQQCSTRAALRLFRTGR